MRSVARPHHRHVELHHRLVGAERLNEEANKVFATGGGMAASDGYYYVTQYREAMGFEEIKTINYKMNGDWSEYDSYTSDITKVATTMAYSPARDQAFGCFVNADRNGYVFCEYNYSYFGIKRTIAEIDTDKVWAGSAFSSDNTLYAITRQGDLYTVDLSTGAMTLVGSTGIETKYLADATIDTDTDTMYWCVNSDTEKRPLHRKYKDSGRQQALRPHQRGADLRHVHSPRRRRNSGHGSRGYIVVAVAVVLGHIALGQDFFLAAPLPVRPAGFA